MVHENDTDTLFYTSSGGGSWVEVVMGELHGQLVYLRIHDLAVGVLVPLQIEVLLMVVFGLEILFERLDLCHYFVWIQLAFLNLVSDLLCCFLLLLGGVIDH